MSYDHWKSTTPEDEADELETEAEAKARRVERMIDELESGFDPRESLDI